MKVEGKNEPPLGSNFPTDPLDIDSRPAGPDMDALMAEKVMGWRVVEWNSGPEEVKNLSYETHLVRWEDGTNSLYRPLNNEVRGWMYDDAWCPSEKHGVRDAWEVVEKIKRQHGRGFFVRETKRRWQNIFVWECGWIYTGDHGEDEYDVVGEGDTASLAICRAALKTAAK